MQLFRNEYTPPQICKPPLSGLGTESNGAKKPKCSEARCEGIPARALSLLAKQEHHAFGEDWMTLIDRAGIESMKGGWNG